MNIKNIFCIISGIWECTEWVLCNIRIYLCSDPKTGTVPPDYVNKSPDYPVDKRNFACCTRITWCMLVEVPATELRNVNFNSGIISGIVPQLKILLYLDPSCPFVSEYRMIIVNVHAKLDLVTTRFSELHNLVNKSQFPSYFIIYHYSI